MKRIILVAVITLFTMAAFAQISNEDLAIVQSVFRKDKKELVKANIKLSAVQAQGFWPIYDDYETKRVELSNKRIAIINEYLKNYKTLTDQNAASLTNRIFENDKEYTDLGRSYYKKIATVIGGLNAAKFFQLENYLQAIVRLHVQDELPFIGELDKHKH